MGMNCGEKPPYLQVLGVSFRYDGVEALDDVSFQVLEGEMACIIGPNGSGKTTLLKCIAGALRGYRGSIILDGADIRGMGPRSLARKVAVVPQEQPVEFEFNVEDLVMMGREPHLPPFGRETPRDVARVEEAMRATSTLHLAGRSALALSGGEKQRVIIARALAQEPRVLLLDEPTAHLDLAYQHDILGLLRDLNEETGITVIAAMHDLNLAARYFSKFILICAGRVVAAGDADRVITVANLRRAYGVEARIHRQSVFDGIVVEVVGRAGPP